MASVQGDDGVTIHFLGPDDVLTDELGVPGDMVYHRTGAGISVYGPKLKPKAGNIDPLVAPFAKPTGTWPAANALEGLQGAAGPRGPGQGRPAPNYAVSGVRYTAPDYVNSTVANGALLAGQLSTLPFIVGPAGLLMNGLACVVGTVPQSGGAATCTLAIYKDDGTDGVTPKWVDGPIASGPVDMTATGNRVAPVGPLNLVEGLYHLAFLYVITNATGHTQPNILNINGAIARFASTNMSGQVRGFIANGTFTSMPAAGPGPYPVLALSVSAVPMVAVRSGS